MCIIWVSMWVSLLHFLCGKIKIYSSTHMKNISLTEMLKVSRNDHAGSSMASSNVHWVWIKSCCPISTKFFTQHHINFFLKQQKVNVKKKKKIKNISAWCLCYFTACVNVYNHLSFNRSKLLKPVFWRYPRLVYKACRA